MILLDDEAQIMYYGDDQQISYDKIDEICVNLNMNKFKLCHDFYVYDQMIGKLNQLMEECDR